MTQFIQFAPTTSAVTTNPFYSDQYPTITVSADNLSGVEIVHLYSVAGSTLDQVVDPITGTPINLTATVKSVALEGGPRYVFAKSATVAPCAVYVDPRER